MTCFRPQEKDTHNESDFGRLLDAKQYRRHHCNGPCPRPRSRAPTALLKTFPPQLSQRRTCTSAAPCARADHDTHSERCEGNFFRGAVGARRVQAKGAATAPGVLNDGVVSQGFGHGATFFLLFWGLAQSTDATATNALSIQSAPKSVVQNCSLSSAKLFTC